MNARYIVVIRIDDYYNGTKAQLEDAITDALSTRAGIGAELICVEKLGDTP